MNFDFAQIAAFLTVAREGRLGRAAIGVTQPALNRLIRRLERKLGAPPRSSGPYRDLERLFADQGPRLPEIAVEIRSITMLKSLVMISDFLSVMAEPMFVAEYRAGLIDALPVAHARLERTLVAFRRRRGVLSHLAAELVAEVQKTPQSGSSLKIAVGELASAGKILLIWSHVQLMVWVQCGRGTKSQSKR